MMATDPLAKLKRAMELGGQRPTLRWEEAAESDPLAALRALVQRGDARDDAPPFDALRELMARARELPEPQPWTGGQGDPLERLTALWRHPEAPAVPAGAATQTAAPPQTTQNSPANSTAAPSPSRAPRPARAESDIADALGEQVYRALSERPLPGDIRATAAARLAGILSARAGEDAELRAVLDLLIFER